ncbi:MAG: hypothetical protein ACPHRO_05620 [Nannocystaceae bacterium]
MTTLFVGGLPEHTSTRIIKNADHTKCRGFAYVTVTSKTEALEAVRQIDGTSVDGCRVRVDFAT